MVLKESPEDGLRFREVIKKEISKGEKIEDYKILLEVREEAKTLGTEFRGRMESFHHIDLPGRVPL